MLWSSSEDEDNDIVEILPKKRLVRPRINFDLDDFVSRFRIDRTTMDDILNKIGRELTYDTDRNFPLSPKEQLLLAIRFFATGAFMQIVGDAHGPHKSTVCRKVKKVTELLIDHYFDSVVRWPDNVTRVANNFYAKGKMPCVIGCMDGTHIPIKAPVENEPQFINRHGTHSLNCMMVCGRDFQFYYVSSRWPGSVNDARVYRNSSLCKLFDEGWLPLEDAIVLADSGYACTEKILTPCLKSVEDFSPAEKSYNISHKKTRRIIENAFGLLKQRFACLNFLRVDPLYAAKIVMACCILHNLILKNEPSEDIMPEEEPRWLEESDAEVREARNEDETRRNQIIANYFT